MISVRGEICGCRRPDDSGQCGGGGAQPAGGDNPFPQGDPQRDTQGDPRGEVRDTDRGRSGAGLAGGHGYRQVLPGDRRQPLCVKGANRISVLTGRYPEPADGFHLLTAPERGPFPDLGERRDSWMPAS